MPTEQPETATPSAPLPKPICGFTALATLHRAAVDALAAFDAAQNGEGGPLKLLDTMHLLHVAVAGVDEAAREAAELYDSVTAQVGRVGDQDGDVDVIGDWTHWNGGEPGDGGGYWVDAWVFVEQAEMCRICGADLSHDEGTYQGACGNCADKAETRGAEKAARAAGWTHDPANNKFVKAGINHPSVDWDAGWMQLCEEEEIAYEPCDPEESES